MKSKLVLFAAFVFFIVSFPTAAQGPTPTAKPPSTLEYVVTAANGTLRSGPGTNFARIGSVKKGDKLQVYDETPQTAGWLRVFRAGEKDAFIADFLVAKTTPKFYPSSQAPLFTVSGKGKAVTEVYDIPRGAYRIDATAADNAFILKIVPIAGNCDEDIIFNEIDFDAKQLEVSGLFVSSGCSVVFEIDNIQTAWSFEIRDIVVDADFLKENGRTLQDGSTISGVGRALTMATFLPAGAWKISADVQDNAFILSSRVLSGHCDDTTVFNELDLNSKALTASTVYRSPETCIIFWETSNVQKAWTITFEKLR